MTSRTATLLRIIALGALGLGPAACKAVDLAPQTETAEAANAAARGYPRLADVPPEPEDAACVRAALSDALIAVERPAETVASPFADDDVDLFEDDDEATPDTVYRAAIAAGPAGAGPYTSVLSTVRSLADIATGDSDGRADAGEDTEPVYVECPPGPGAQAANLAAARAELERVAAEMRAARPVAPDLTIELPADMPARPAPEASQ